MNENYYATKLDSIVNKSFELKTLYCGYDVIDKNTAIELVSENFDYRKNTEKHIINTFKKHVNIISPPVFENKIIYNQFIYGISFSIVNALTSGNYYAKYFLKKVIDLISIELDIEDKKILKSTNDQNAKILIQKQFETNPEVGHFPIAGSPIKSEEIDFYKRVYSNALSATYSESVVVTSFFLNLLLNIVKSHEINLEKESQQLI